MQLGEQLYAGRKAGLAVHGTLSAQILNLMEKLDPVPCQQSTWKVSSFTLSVHYKAADLSWPTYFPNRAMYAVLLWALLSLPSCLADVLSVLIWLSESYTANSDTQCGLLRKKQKVVLLELPVYYRLNGESRANCTSYLQTYSRWFAKKFHCSFE